MGHEAWGGADRLPAGTARCVQGAALGPAPHERPAAARRRTGVRRFKQEVNAGAFIRHLTTKIRIIMPVVNL